MSGELGDARKRLQDQVNAANNAGAYQPCCAECNGCPECDAGLTRLPQANDTPPDTRSKVETLAEIITAQLVLYTLPANYNAPINGQTHEGVALRCGQIIAEQIASDWLAKHDAQVAAKAWDVALAEVEQVLYVARDIRTRLRNRNPYRADRIEGDRG